MLNKIDHSYLANSQKSPPTVKPKALAEKVDGVAKEILDALTGADKASVVVTKPSYTAMPDLPSIAGEVNDFIVAEEL